MLVLLALLMTVAAALLMERLNERALVWAEYDEATGRALQLAKSALIAWSVSHPDTPGRLPFPDRSADSDFDGLSDCVNIGTPVAATHLLGRYPWRGDDAPRSGCLYSISTWPLTARIVDGTNNEIWYAVSDRLVFNGNGGPVNVGLLDGGAGGSWLTVVNAKGDVISDRVAAVLIAPGAPGECQDRNLAISDTDYVAQYLDRVSTEDEEITYDNSDEDGVFVISPALALREDQSCSDTPAPSSYNDRVAYITADELLAAVQKRVTSEVAAALQKYKNDHGHYPWMSPFAAPDRPKSGFNAVNGQTWGQLSVHGSALGLPGWLVQNEWYRYLLVSYPAAMGPTGSGACTPGADCVSVAANDVAGAVIDAWAVVASSGGLLPGQLRSGVTPALAGFEEDNADGDGLTAERKPATTAFNDHVVTVECGPGPLPVPCR
jgi:hypothetical protein